MSKGRNNIIRSFGQKSLFDAAQNVHNSTTTYNQGDLLCFDTTNKVLKTLTAETDAATFCGVAVETVVNGKTQSPYTSDVDASAAAQLGALPGPAYNVITKQTSKTGDAWTPGCAVYAAPTVDKDAVSITGTKQIGIYQGPTIASAAAGQQVEVKLGARYPADTLNF
jgi:hypothetical protein